MTTVSKPTYQVEPFTLDNDKVHYRCGGLTSPNRADAERRARFLNSQEEYSESDPDWTPGSNSNWWARNSGTEGGVQ